MLTMISFIFVLGVLIFFHELGHFLVAKKAGIRVEKFSLGFPPNIFARKWGETTYCIGLIPLGGYVKMAGENPDEESTGGSDEFMSKSVARRAAVIFAGPFMNYVLAIVLLIAVFYFGGRPTFDSDRVMVGELLDGAPAQEAGLQVNDQIIAVNDEPVSLMDSLRMKINAHVEEEIKLTWIHGNDTITRPIVTRATPIPNLEGDIDTVGTIGFMQQISGYEEYGLGESITAGFRGTHVIVSVTLNFVYQVISGRVSSKMIGGPLFIARQSGKEAQKGMISLLRFMALLSVNLAVLNVLPIPVLDGGHLVFLGIEKLKGSPLSMKARIAAQQVGLFVLLGLILFVTYNDIIRVVKGI